MQFEFDPSDRRCRYLRINGARCRSAALDGDHLCFEHKMRKLRTRPGRKPTCLPDTFGEIPLVSFCWVEDHASVLHNLNHIIEAFARGAIDHRQAMTYACLMRTCLKTLKQMRDLEDEAAELKEKPAQRFELDECELPLAIDEPRVPNVCEGLADMASPEPETCTSPEPGNNPGVPPVCEGLADMASPEPEPCTPEPVTGNNPGVPPVSPALADTAGPNLDPQPEPVLGNLPDAAFLALNPHWEETMRRYYKNDPALLASIGLQPLPKPAKASPDPAPCNPQPETCNLNLTAAAEGGLNPNPQTLNLAPPHTYTSNTKSCEAQ